VHGIFVFTLLRLKKGMAAAAEHGGGYA